MKKAAPLSFVNNTVVLISDGWTRPRKHAGCPVLRNFIRSWKIPPKRNTSFVICLGPSAFWLGRHKNGFCLPFFMNLHDGVKTIFGWSALSKLQESMLYKWVNRDMLPPKHMERPYSCWIRYFLFLPVMKLLNELNASETAEMDIVSNAESHVMFY